MYLNIYIFFKVAVTHWEEMAPSHLNQRCLCQKQKKSTLHTQYLEILVGLIRPPGESAGIFCSVHPQVSQETHRDFTDVHSFSRTARRIHVTAHGMFTTCFYFVVKKCLHSCVFFKCLLKVIWVGIAAAVIKVAVSTMWWQFGEAGPAEHPHTPRARHHDTSSVLLQRKHDNTGCEVAKTRWSKTVKRHATSSCANMSMLV